MCVKVFISLTYTLRIVQMKCVVCFPVSRVESGMDEHTAHRLLVQAGVVHVWGPPHNSVCLDICLHFSQNTKFKFCESFSIKLIMSKLFSENYS